VYVRFRRNRTRLELCGILRTVAQHCPCYSARLRTLAYALRIGVCTHAFATVCGTVRFHADMRCRQVRYRAQYERGFKLEARADIVVKGDEYLKGKMSGSELPEYR